MTMSRDALRGRSVLVVLGLALTGCAIGDGRDAPASGGDQTSTGPPPVTTSAPTSGPLDTIDQVFVDELRAIDGLTFAGTDQQFLHHAELTVCYAFNMVEGDSDEVMADFRRYNPEISEHATRELVRVTVTYLCPEYEDRLVD